MKVFGGRAATRPQGAIIDLDGTLYPRDKYSETVLALIQRMFVELHELPKAVAAERVDELRSAMRDNWSDTSTTRFVLANGFAFDDWTRFRNNYFNIHEKLRPSPEVADQLMRLKMHVKTALLTNNAREAAENILESLQLPEQLFDVIVCAEDTRLAPKPDMMAFGEALSRLDVQAESCWALGDRYSIDIAPLVELGGSGIEVSGPEELKQAVSYIIDFCPPIS